MAFFCYNHYQMPKNAKKITYKEKEFETYVLWKSLPAHFRGMKKELLQSYGFTDPLVIKIAMLKNQTAFAKKFGIKDLGTLTDWNNKIEKNKLNTHTPQTAFEKQIETIDNLVSTNPDKLLEKKIHAQRKIIISLKKEIHTLKKQIAIKPQKKPVIVIPHVPVPTLVTPPPPEQKKSLLQKAISFFTDRK